jgi:hypothetical protein
MTIEQFNALMKAPMQKAIAAEQEREAELSAIEDYFNNLRDPKSE